MSQVPAEIPADEVFVFPLSFAQQRLWFLHQMDPASAAYNVQLALRLSGRLNVDALKWALNEIVSRHEILRTTFDVLDQQPVQLIAAEENLTLAVRDLSSFPQAEREVEAERLASEEAQRPFDLVRGPLIRGVLIRLWTNEHLLLVTMHHIVSDGWSQTVFMNELGALYEACVAGRRSPLPELSIQYADFAEWQREWLRGELLDQQLEYWLKQLAGTPASLDLPTDRPRPVVQSFNGARESFALSRDLSARLIELSRREDATLFMTLLAAFYVLLYRYTAETDIVIGTPVANRNRKELEPLIGFFVNTLPLRADLSGDPTFRELLARVREVSLGAYAHQDVPFEMLVEKLSPVRDPSRNPLFQVMFALQNTPEATSQPSELLIKPVDVKTNRAQFDLTLDVTEAGGQLHVSLVYNTDLFDASTIRRVLGHYETLLEGFIDDSARPISQLSLLKPAEEKMVVRDWNETSTDYGPPSSLHGLFEAQAARTPDTVALVFENQQMTYADLNRRANQLARHLRTRGVRAETRVGVMLERSLDMVISLLGILKAGGAYVPLDPAYPEERMIFMLADSEVHVLLTETRLQAGLEIPCEVICLQSEWEKIATFSDTNPEIDVSGANLAYIIYTSGSTGKPKGAMNTHAAIFNRLSWMQEAYQLTAVECVLQKTPFSFDVSVWEFFWPLMTGAGLVLARPGGHRDSAYLAELIRREQITTLHFVPPMLHVFLAEEGIEACTSLRRVICSGEALSRELQDRFYARLPDVELHNLYGPTEAAVDVTWWACDRASSLTSVPIGRPIANTQIYLLDPYKHSVPPGVPGELYIGGVQLARGYHMRPALTAEKFVPAPFTETPGARLYRTGDMARYLADGNITFLGRRDEQLKIRGLRIEPAEIETTLKEHASVANAAVVMDQDRRLVAYFAVQPHTVVTGEELRIFTRQRLPDYMVPSFFVVLDQLPLTASGKVDRVALRARDNTQIARNGERVAPRDLLESQLARIWEDLLHVEPGVRDNFFELGGHSLLVVPLLARVEELTGKALDVAAVFKAPTIESLAALLRPDVDLSASTPLIAMQPHGSSTPVFFVHPAGGSVAGYFALARALGTNRPFYALEGTREITGRQIELKAANYVQAIRALRPDGPYLLGGWSTGGVIAFEMARQLEERGADVSLVVLLDSAPPADDKGNVDENVPALAGFAVNLGVSIDLLSTASQDLLQAPIETQLNWILDQSRRVGVLPSDVGLDELRRRFELYQADIEAVKNYHPPAVSLPLLLLRATDEPDDPEATARWSRLTCNKLEVHNVPGDHVTMMRAPYVSTLAEVLRAHFARTEQSAR